MSAKPRRGKVSTSHLAHLAVVHRADLGALARQAAKELHEMTVTAGTSALYHGRVGVLEGVLIHLNDRRRANGMPPEEMLEWDTELFILFCRRLVEVDMAMTGAGYLNAVIFVQRGGCFGRWALEDHELLRRLIKGGTYQSGRRRLISVRGQMDEAMFDSFIEFLIASGRPPSLVLAMQAAYFMALRISEVIRLLYEHVMYGAEGEGASLDLPNKAYKAGNGKPPRVQKIIDSPEAMIAIFSAAAGKKMGDFVFPRAEWNEKTARDSVKEWAAKHRIEFPVLDSVFMDGPHVARHGGMARIMERVKELMEESLLAGIGACSSRNVHRYATSNAERAKRVRNGI